MPRFLRVASGGRMAHTPAPFTFVLLVALAVAACGTASATTPPTPTTPPPTPTPATLFQADWSRGLDGWQATSGWRVVKGVLQNTLGAERSLTIPSQPPAGAYAIELDLQIVSIPVQGGYFIFDVPAGPNGDGYQAGVQGLRVPGVARPNGDHPTIRTLITPLSDQDSSVSIRSSQADFEPGDQIRTYRIEVNGNAVRMSVDGRFLVFGDSIRGPNLAGGPLVFRVSGAVFNITGLRILAL